MIGRSDLIAGWCPGALRPMASGDGLIVRVRPRLGRVSLVQLETLAKVAARFGDGSLYLSNRANIQIRAVPAEAHAPLLEALGTAGLIDSDPRAEAVRNVMLVPGFGADAHIEAAMGFAARLENLLENNAALHALPGKFGAAIQTGTALDAAAISDITFLVQDNAIAMMLDGDRRRAAFFENRKEAADGFLRAAVAFLKARRAHPEIRRMRDAVRTLGTQWIEEEAALSMAGPGIRFDERAPRLGDLGEAFGMAFSFGEIPGAALKAITETMRARGIGFAEVSPHRAFFFPCEEEQDNAAFRDLAIRIGAATKPEDIRLRVHGCPGEPACSRATVPARRNAEDVLSALAGTAFEGEIHISGCEKRCAFPHSARIAAIGGAGAYTIFGPGSQIRRNIAPKDLAQEIPGLLKSPS